MRYKSICPATGNIKNNAKPLRISRQLFHSKKGDFMSIMNKDNMQIQVRLKRMELNIKLTKT